MDKRTFLIAHHKALNHLKAIRPLVRLMKRTASVREITDGLIFYEAREAKLKRQAEAFALRLGVAPAKEISHETHD